ncbi:MAG: CHAP domain-containing protein [Gaiellaceae bacterium]
MKVCAGATVAVVLLVASAPAGAARGRVLYGYPYASRCPEAGIADKVDRWGMYECNCTSYVAWALQANGQSIDWFIRGAMNAWNWPHVAGLDGIPVGTRPRAGAVAVWPKESPPFGHLAYVSAVEPNGTFDIAEYNASIFEPFVFDVRKGVRARGVTFIYVPARE